MELTSCNLIKPRSVCFNFHSYKIRILSPNLFVDQMKNMKIQTTNTTQKLTIKKVESLVYFLNPVLTSIFNKFSLQKTDNFNICLRILIFFCKPTDGKNFVNLRDQKIYSICTIKNQEMQLCTFIIFSTFHSVTERESHIHTLNVGSFSVSY